MALISLFQAIDSVLTCSKELSIPVYVVGGVVRDLLLGRQSIEHDIDVLVDGSSEMVARRVGQMVGGKVAIHARFLTAKVCLEDDGESNSESDTTVSEIDFASARRESYREPGALPAVEAAPLSDDLGRRDFTVNAMALPLMVYRSAARGEISLPEVQRSLIDPFGGMNDLAIRTVRVLHPFSFRDDPTRLLRSVRYKVRLRGEIEPATAELLRAAVREKYLDQISFQRYVRELFIILEEDNALDCIRGVLSSSLFWKTSFSHEHIALLEKRIELATFLSQGETQQTVIKVRREVLIASILQLLPTELATSIPISAKERKQMQAVVLGKEKATNPVLSRVLSECPP